MTAPGDPRWDDETHARVRRIVNLMLLQVEDVLRRRTDADGTWEPPGDVGKFSDTTGLINVARNSAVRPLLEIVTNADRALGEVLAEVKEYTRKTLDSGSTDGDSG